MVDLGRKYECDECGIKVYDLGRAEVRCPRCGRDLKLDIEDRVPTPMPPHPQPAVTAESSDDTFTESAEGDDEDLAVEEDLGDEDLAAAAATDDDDDTDDADDADDDDD